MGKQIENWLKKMPQVYHQTRRLLLQLLASTAKGTRILRYGLVADTANLILAVMKDIAFADKYDIRPEDRAAYIRTAQVKMDEVKVSIRVLYDIHAMKKTGFSALTDLESNVDLQLSRWLGSIAQL